MKVSRDIRKDIGHLRWIVDKCVCQSSTIPKSPLCCLQSSGTTELLLTVCHLGVTVCISWGCMHSLNAALLLCEFRWEGDLHKSSLTRGTKASSVGPLGWKQDRKWFTDLLCSSCTIPLCPRGFHLLGLLTLHNCSGNCITMNQLESYNWLLKMDFLK